MSIILRFSKFAFIPYRLSDLLKNAFETEDTEREKSFEKIRNLSKSLYLKSNSYLEADLLDELLKKFKNSYIYSESKEKNKDLVEEYNFLQTFIDFEKLTIEAETNEREISTVNSKKHLLK